MHRATLKSRLLESPFQWWNTVVEISRGSQSWGQTIYAIHSLLQFTIKLTQMKGQPSVFQAGEWGPITITRWWSSACKISIFLVRAKLLQSCPTVWDSMGHTPQAPLSPMRFFCKDYWSSLPCPPPGNLPRELTSSTPAALCHFLELETNVDNWFSII